MKTGILLMAILVTVLGVSLRDPIVACVGVVLFGLLFLIRKQGL